jgi:hypothetical protein
MITKIESLLDKELAKVQGNDDVCSDILGSQKSKILEDRISSMDSINKAWSLTVGWTKRWILS